MRFLKTLFWIVIAALLSIFAVRNWRDVTVDLWGNLQADVKLPVLLLIVFVLGFLPTYLTYRARLWRLENRVATTRERVPTLDEPEEPVT